MGEGVYYRAKNLDTGHIEELDESTLSAAIGQGTHDFVPDEVYRLLDSDGNIRDIAGEGARLAMDEQGFGFESAGGAQQRAIQSRLRHKYDNAGGQLVAGLKGTAKGLSLGLSDVALGAAFPTEDLRAIEEYNAGTHLAGDIVGSIAPALATGGASLGARGAGIAGKEAAELSLREGGEALGRNIAADTLKYTPAGLAARAGERIAARSKDTLLSDVIHHGVGYGVEGALFSTGNYLSDVALDKKELSAEAFVGSLNDGALWGGGLGAGMAAANRAVGSLGRAVQSLKKGEDVPSTTLDKVIPRKRRKKASVRRSQERMEEEMARQFAAGEGLAAQANKIFEDVHIEQMRRRANQIPEEAAALTAQQRTQRALDALGPDDAPVTPFRAEPRLTAKERIRRAREDLAGDTSEVGDDLLGQQLRATVDEQSAARIAAKKAEMEASRAKVHDWISRMKARSERITGPGKGTAWKQTRSGSRAIQDAETAAEKMKSWGLQMREDEIMAAVSDMRIGLRKVSDDAASKASKAAKDVADTTKETIEKLNFDPKTGEVFEDIFDIARYEKAQFELAEELRPHVSLDDVKRLDDHVKPYRDSMAKSAARSSSDTGGLLSGLGKAGEFYELLNLMGVPLPQVDDLPVVGPLLGAYLKFRLGMTALGKTKILAGPTAQAATRAASVQNKISDAIERFAKPAAGAAKKAKPAVIPMSSVLGHKLFESDAKVEKLEASANESQRRAELYKARLDELSRAAANPDMVKQKVRESVPLGDPELQQQIEETVARKLQFLHKVAPKDPRPPNPAGLPPRPWSPDIADLTKFARYVRAAEDPTSVLDDLESGALTIEAVEALKTVYPALYGSIQEEIIDNLAEYREELPYSKRVSLSSLFDAPVEETMSPQYMVATKEHWDKVAAQEAAQAEQGSPSINPQVASSLGELAAYDTSRRALR